MGKYAAGLTVANTAAKKPWGGLFDDGAVGAGPAEGPDWLDVVGILLRKFTELCLMSALVAVPLMYHLSVPVGVAEWFRATLKPGYFFHQQFSPWIMGLLPVLETKFAAWFVFGLLMLAGYLSIQVLEKLSWRPILAPIDGVARSSRSSRYRMIPLAAAAGYVIYSIVSFLLWAPAVPPEAQSGSAGDGIGQFGGGGFFYSLTAWLQVTFAFVFFLVAEDIIRRRTLVNRIMGLLVVVGVINALTVILLKVEFKPLMAVWFKFAETETRNNLGAFIGHNTGVSSFLMAPALVCLTWVVSIQPRKSQLFRTTAAVSFLVIILALVLAQSRAVVPIILACGAGLVFVLRRRACLIPKTRAYIWVPVAIAFVVVTQFVPNKFNRLYRADVTMTERIGEFRPHRLMTETRLRILVVSVTQLFPDAPILGHGFGTFQYVYPEAQGRYFEKHPRSLLAPTPLRTNIAHNEYLQVLVETGIVGLVIVLGGLFYLLRGGYLVMKRSLMPHHISAEAAIFFSVVAILAHGLFDFPLRIPPIAVTLVVLLAIWSAGNRLWIFPLKPPKEEDALAVEEARAEMRVQSIVLRPGLWAAFGAAVLLLLLYSGAVFFSRSINPFVTAATLENRAASLFASAPRAPDLLRSGWADIEDARRIFWISGPVNLTHARGRYLIALQNYRQADRLAKDGELEQAARYRDLGFTIANGAINEVNVTLQEQKWHFMYNLRSTINRLIAENSVGEQRAEYTTRADLDLYRAVAMNPGDADAITELIRTLRRSPEANHSELARYLGLLHYFHPGVFSERIFSRVMDALALEESEDAYREMAFIIEAVPEPPLHQLTWAQLSIRAGQFEQARDIINRFLEQAIDRDEESTMYREGAEMAQIELAIAQNNLDFALAQLQQDNRFRFTHPAQIMTMRLILLKRLGQKPEEQRALGDAIQKLGRNNPIAYQIAGATAYRFFPDFEEAVRWLELRRDARPPAPAMDLQAAMLLAKSYAHIGRVNDAIGLIPLIESRGDTPYARELARRFVDRLRTLEQPAAPEPEEPAP